MIEFHKFPLANLDDGGLVEVQIEVVSCGRRAGVTFGDNLTFADPVVWRQATLDLFDRATHEVRRALEANLESSGFGPVAS